MHSNPTGVYIVLCPITGTEGPGDQQAYFSALRFLPAAAPSRHEISGRAWTRFVKPKLRVPL